VGVLEVVYRDELHVDGQVELAQQLVEHPYALPLCIQPSLPGQLLSQPLPLFGVAVPHGLVGVCALGGVGSTALRRPRGLALVVHGGGGGCVVVSAPIKATAALQGVYANGRRSRQARPTER
jgi:hypothetical protein